MTKSTKIMMSVIGSVLALCIVVTAGVSISKMGDTPDEATTIGSSAEETTAEETIAVPETTLPPEEALKTAILGLWRDSADMSGYKFKTDGYVEVTYVNLTVPVINVPINGTAKGTYSLKGNELTVSFSIYSKTITKRYTASVENNTLSLIDREDGETATYTKMSENASAEMTVVMTTLPTEATTQVPVIQKGIYGDWISGAGDIEYTFFENGTFCVTYKDAKVPEISKGEINGKYNGVFMTDDDEDSIVLQFSMDSKKVTVKYDYKLTQNALSFEGSEDDTTIFVRKQISSAPADASSLLGAWSDSADMSGYNFKDGGIVEITYVNFTVPVINMPINGTYNGTYTLDGNRIRITASIYSNTISDEYTYSIDGNTLTLTAVDDGEISTYHKK